MVLATLGGCAIVATRPVQEMSDTASAIRAAREVQADTLAPELYRQAGEWFLKAKNDYRMKNFSLAHDEAGKARMFAEQAEYEAMRNGGNRAASEGLVSDPLGEVLPGSPPPPPPEPAPTFAPYTYPTPVGKPMEGGAEPPPAQAAPPPAPAQPGQPPASGGP